GWVLVQVAHVQPYPPSPLAAPAPAAPAPAAPAAPGVDLDAAFGALLADPVRLARLRAVLGAPAPAAPPAVPTADGLTSTNAGPVEAAQPKESVPSNVPAPAAQGLAAELEALTGDPALGPLLAALTAGGSA
ncbi:MAG TPA: hypothetical protein VM694_39835, partial [Polyangium sp.]|nr:hypothetical protein [Polyangium sp.]